MNENELLIEFSKFKGEVTTKLDRAVSDIAEMRLETSKVMEKIAQHKIDKDEVYRHWMVTDSDRKEVWRAITQLRWLVAIGIGMLYAVEAYLKFFA